MTITITQDHINRGVPCDGGSCPIALALFDVYPHATTISVGLDYAVVREDGIARKFILTDEAEAFMASFDYREPVSPMSFDPEIVAYEDK